MDINAMVAALGLVPVIKLTNADDAVPLCKALLGGGLPIAEITFRTDAAAQSIARVAEALPEVLVGAGTVLTVEQADQAIDAGARFVVAPGLNPEVGRRVLERGVAYIPGCATAGDIERALGLGLKLVKFFPAEAMGGPAAIKALGAAYSGVSFLPTGGINAGNLNDYLSLPNVSACGGSWMAPGALIDSGDFSAIEALTRSALRTMMGFDLRHVGINLRGHDEALEAAYAFEALFGWTVRDTPGSAFAGTMVELLKAPSMGARGHIAVGCNSVERAKAYLKQLGFAFEPGADRVQDGVVQTAFLKDEIGGFAVHLLRK